jgi:hypothetical protein
MMEGLSLVPFWRAATMNEVPAEAPSDLTMELLLIGSVDLSDPRRIDARLSDE